jgi:hypothetical protein
MGELRPDFLRASFLSKLIELREELRKRYPDQFSCVHNTREKCMSCIFEQLVQDTIEMKSEARQ